MIYMFGKSRAFKGWASWDESSEGSLADNDTFVCLFENPSANGDETGQGGELTGADLVLTAQDNPAGAVDGYRALDGDDWFATSTAVAEIVKKDKNWFCCVKVRNVTDGVKAGFFHFGTNNQNNAGLFLYSNKLRAIYYQGSTSYSVSTADDVPNNVVIYAGIWSDGTNPVRIGWSTTKFNSWSDIPAGQRVELDAGATGDLTGMGTVDCHCVGTYDQTATSDQAMTGDIAWVVVSKKCLID